MTEAKIYTSTREVTINEINDIHLDSYGRLKVSNPTIQLELTQDHPTFKRHVSDMEVSGNGTSSKYDGDASVTYLNVSNSLGVRRLRSRACAIYLTGKSLTIYMSYCFNSTNLGVSKKVGFFDDGDGIFLENREGKLYWVLRTSVSGTVEEKRIAQSDWLKPDLPTDSTTNGDLYIKIPWISNGNVSCGFLVDDNPITAYTFDNSGSNKPFIRTCNLYPTFEIERFSGGSSSDTLTSISYAVITDGKFDKVGNNYSVFWKLPGSGLSDFDDDHDDWSEYDYEYYEKLQRGHTGSKGVTRPLVLFRLNPKYINTVIVPVKSSVATRTDKGFYLHLLKNPVIRQEKKDTLVTSFSWKDLNNSGIQYSIYPDDRYYVSNVTSASVWTEIGGKETEMIQSNFNTLDVLGTEANNTPELWALAITCINANERIEMATIDFMELK